MDSSTSLSSLLRIVKQDEFLVVVPVFNISDSWSAAKIATKKLQVSKLKLITCVPCGNDYICVFRSTVEPDVPFPVYKASSEGKAS